MVCAVDRAHIVKPVKACLIELSDGCRVTDYENCLKGAASIVKFRRDFGASDGRRGRATLHLAAFQFPAEGSQLCLRDGRVVWVFFCGCSA